MEQTTVDFQMCKVNNKNTCFGSSLLSVSVPTFDLIWFIPFEEITSENRQ